MIGADVNCLDHYRYKHTQSLCKKLLIPISNLSNHLLHHVEILEGSVPLSSPEKLAINNTWSFYHACIIFLEFKLWPHIRHFFLCLHLKSQLVERLPLIKFGFNSVLLFTILILSYCLIGQLSWQNLLLLHLSHVILL